MAGQGFWTGLERATGNIANTGMNLLQFQAGERHRERLEADSATRMGMEQQRLEIAQGADVRQGQIQEVQLQQANIELRKNQEEEARLNKRTYKDSVPALFPQMAKAPGLAEHAMTNTTWHVDETGREYTTERDRTLYRKRLAEDAAFQKTAMEAVIGDYGLNRNNVIKQLTQLGAAPVDAETGAVDQNDPKYKKWAAQGAQLREQLSQLDQDHSIAAKTLGELNGTLLKHEQAKELKQMELDAKVTDVQAPSGIREFEIRTYGKEVPELRGKPEYKSKFAEYEEGKNQTETQLIARSLKGDKEAKAILDSQLSRKKDIAAAGRDPERIDKSNRVFGVSLRKEFNSLPEVKESNLIMPKIKNIEQAYEESLTTKNFVAVDQALITLYNKLTDPASVVRESEYARTAQNIPLINAIKGKAQKVLEGGAGLTKDERAALLQMAQLMRLGYQEIRSGRVREYRSYANDAGLDGESLIIDIYEGQQPGRASTGAAPPQLRSFLRKK